MRRLLPANRLGCCALLLLAVCGSALLPAAQAHGRHKKHEGTGALQIGTQIQPPPNGDPIYAQCVPKYQTTLVVPPPMPENTSPRPKSLQGPGCFDFAHVRPSYCSQYNKPYPEAYPYPYAEAQAQGQQGAADTPEGGARELQADTQGRRRPSETYHKDERYRGEHYAGEPYHGSKPYHGEKPYAGNKPYPGKKPYRGERPYHGEQYPGPPHGDYYPKGPSHNPSYPMPDYAHDDHKRHYYRIDKPADKPYYEDGPYSSPPPYDITPDYPDSPDYPNYQPTYGGDYYDYPPSECMVDCFNEYQISVRPHTQRALPNNPNPSAGGITCPPSFGTTNVFAYGPSGQSNGYNWPAFTIEAQRYRPNRIQWNNELMERRSGPTKGNYVQHILKEAVDQTLHWANPGKLGGQKDENPCANCPGTDASCRAGGACDTAAAATEYDGPVPIVTHVHGMEDVRDYSDGYTEAWFLPKANNLAGYDRVGTWYDTFEQAYMNDTCQPYSNAPGSADFIYPNTQRPSTAWYHDHTLGMTRLNVYSGMAGFYFIRDFLPVYQPGVRDTGPELPGLPYPPPSDLTDPVDVREIPLAIQDRMFQQTSQGSELWYPVKVRDPTNDLPNGPLHPLWLPEFPFVQTTLGGDELIIMTVNGKAWPKTTISPDTYRLRLLNGCNARTLVLKFAKRSNTYTDFDFNTAPAGTFTDLEFYVVGNEAGFYPQVQGPVTELPMGPAERYDVIIDFTTLSPDEYVYMYNVGPEEPFQTYFGDPPQPTPVQPLATAFTSQLMRFEFDRELSNRQPKPFTIPQTPGGPTCLQQLNAALATKYPGPLPPAKRHRQMALIEQSSDVGGVPTVTAVLLGTVTPGATSAVPQMWAEDVRTTTPTETVEEWDIINLTADAHPIHLHEVVYETISRTPITAPDPNPNYEFQVTNDIDVIGTPAGNKLLDPFLRIDCPASVSLTGDNKCPAQRDVSLILPGFRTTIRFKTGKKPGLFVWHCHLVEHEDNEMMVPWCIGPPGYTNPSPNVPPNTPMCPSADNLVTFLP